MLCKNKNCIKEHKGEFGSGIFCSVQCANSRGSSKGKKKRLKCSNCEEIIEVGLRTSKVKCDTCKFEQAECDECSEKYQRLVGSKTKLCGRKCAAIVAGKTNRKNNIKSSSDFKIYRVASKFKFSLNSFPDKFDFSLVEKYGWYKAKNHGDNSNDISRDHIISCRYGFDNNIPTWIISHPANCELMPHKLNQSKRTKINLTLDELIIKIKEW